MPLVGGGPIRFAPPREFSACTAVNLGDAQDGSVSDPKTIVMELRANWGRASATQLRRVSVDSDGVMSHLVNHVDTALETYDVCRAFDKAPHIPIAGATAVSACNEKVQVGPLFLDELIVTRDGCFFEVFFSTPGAVRKSPGSLGRFLRGSVGDIWLPQVHPE